MTQNLLSDYSKELKQDSEMSLESLIDSHRYLRERYKNARAEGLDQLLRFRELGTEQGYATVTNGKYIAISKLKSMTLVEIVDFIGTKD
jgi:hypothetical protein